MKLVEGLFADVGGVRLHYAEMGKGPLVVLLHGFPEFWYTWKNQIPALAEAGFRVVVPDMRGYNLSDKPRGAASYAAEKLTADVAGLIRAVGEKRAHVVGHDWGAGVAWLFAMRYPEILGRLAILNVPHPVRFLRGLTTLRQLRKSWYMFFFQLPWLPERMIRRDDYAAIRASFGGQSQDDIQRFVTAASQPGALTGAINYYRAMWRRLPRFRPIKSPVLVIWGEKDKFLGLELAQADPSWVPDCRLEGIPEATHWVHWDAPEKVNALLKDFLK